MPQQRCCCSGSQRGALGFAEGERTGPPTGRQMAHRQSFMPEDQGLATVRSASLTIRIGGQNSRLVNFGGNPPQRTSKSAEYYADDQQCRFVVNRQLVCERNPG